MLFNSYEFLFGFLPLTFAGFYLLAIASRRIAVLWMALASVFFYGYWNPKFVLLLLASVTLNFIAGRAIAKRRDHRESRALMAGAVAANLVVLGVFKYTNFFVGTVNATLGTTIPWFEIVLPIGISFFTFTQIAYLVDAHRGLAHEYDFGRYLLFVSYFPHLVAGPVLHHRQIMPQFGNAATFRVSARNVAEGMTLFIIGLAKKVLLADHFGGYATPVFDAAQEGVAPQFLAAWAGALSYTLQLYFDFSGYSDMAMGLSKIFGVDLPVNFDSPYKARNIIEFWRRWHMTLSQFLRDYLYIPLGGNRLGEWRRQVNILVTMLLGGLWHGASWTFVAWGGLHGIYLVVNHGWVRLRNRHPEAPRPSRGRVASTALTFVCVVVAWVLFRAQSFRSAMAILEGMIGANGISLPARWALSWPLDFPTVAFNGPFAGFPALISTRVVPEVALGLAIVWFAPNSIAIARASLKAIESAAPLKIHAIAAVLAGMLTLSLLNMRRVSEFLYFQF